MAKYLDLDGLQKYTEKVKELVNSKISTASGDYVPITDKGSANGVATLDGDGKVPSSQLPSYVDDVVEYASKSDFPASGESGKIYVSQDDNKTYRWSGSSYVEISASLALGETSSTAYPGDKGKGNADRLNNICSDSYWVLTPESGFKFEKQADYSQKLIVAGGYIDSVGELSAGEITASLPVASSSTSGVMTPPMITKLNRVADGAEVNQNAFSTLKVGSARIMAGAKTDVLTVEAGDNVSIVPDATNKKLTISSSNTGHTHTVSKGLLLTGTGGESGEVNIELNYDLRMQVSQPGYETMRAPLKCDTNGLYVDSWVPVLEAISDDEIDALF